jgi:hypothetical protein
MSLRVPVTIIPAGTVVTYSAADVAGDSYQNTGSQKVRYKNSSGGVLTCRVDTPNPDNFGIVDDVHDIVLSVPAGGEIEAGPFNQSRHNDTNGRVQITYPGGVTGLTIAVTQ